MFEDNTNGHHKWIFWSEGLRAPLVRLIKVFRSVQDTLNVQGGLRQDTGKDTHVYSHNTCYSEQRMAVIYTSTNQPGGSFFQVSMTVIIREL